MPTSTNRAVPSGSRWRSGLSETGRAPHPVVAQLIGDERVAELVRGDAGQHAEHDAEQRRQGEVAEEEHA